MATFRTQDHVPDVYTRKSRDFQLFCNLFDCINGGIKYDIDSIIDVVDTNQCNERLIPYLQTKLGFWSNVKMSAENLRIILKGFMYAVRNKGSIKGVERAVQIFLKVARIQTNVHIEVNNNTESDPYTILIGTEEYLGDTSILDEILKYIIPAGYAYKYVFYADKSYETSFEYADRIRIVTGEPSLLGSVRTTFHKDSSSEEEIEYPQIVDNVDQTVVAPKTARNPQVKDGQIVNENGEVVYNESIEESE